jgi:hypothetical protein
MDSGVSGSREIILIREGQSRVSRDGREAFGDGSEEEVSVSGRGLGVSVSSFTLIVSVGRSAFLSVESPQSCSLEGQEQPPHPPPTYFTVSTVLVMKSEVGEK